MLETALSELQAAVIRLTQVIEHGIANVSTITPTPAPIPTLPPTPAPTPAPVVIPVFTAPPVAAPAAMPPPPVFAAPPAGALPFTDGPSLIAYTMGVYKTIGPAKGAGIQDVLSSLDVVNLTDVKPKQYAAFYAGVEALKG